MRALPAGARVYLSCAFLLAGACVVSGTTGLSGASGLDAVPWHAVALLAALYTVCELLPRCPFLGHAVSVDPGAFFPVPLAAVFLLPPSAAALAVLPGGLLGRVKRKPGGVRRVWRAAELSIAVWVASSVRTAWGEGAGDFPGVLVPAGAAILAYCVVLTVLDGGILVTAERIPVRTAWRGHFLRSLAPHCVHGLAGLMMAVLWRSPYGPPAAFFVLLPMYLSCWVFTQYERERDAHRSTIRALAQAVDLKDRYTRGHGERVGRASAMMAAELGMDEERREVLRFAGILHDIGKLGVPTRILRKDGPLTPEERRVIELHPEYGHEMVRGIGFLGQARAAILHHHERMDGSGYPYGLSGERIPEFARVVAVADAFDAMTSTRSYRRARPVEEAVAELERCAGTQFDARMVGALVAALAREGWNPAVTADEGESAGAGLDSQAGRSPRASGSGGPLRGAVPLPAPSRPGPHAAPPREGLRPRTPAPHTPPSSPLRSSRGDPLEGLDMPGGAG
ncbi:HD-GYP domain-containing protein [Streptomyces sp. NBC_00237]|uniref:HD-GYP domain-containing protein n=1 Tax=Streptomyces sp. NBC_00237 TaxID=2975687 RepID=UPI002251D39F|nr:HD-GYP domain-containing protein [Streptomyces sp. NBC_00237]MCX5204329.1 HD-GYP domain-containing protein [Streptomyces sp. NBC_00237]